MGRGTLGDVRDGSVDPWGGPGRFVRPSGRSRTVRETLGEVRDLSEDLCEELDWSEDPRGGPGWVGGSL